MPFISASVISPYNSIRGGAEGGLVPVSLLLDLYPNASAAYSLRKLRTDYSGAAIRVRRSSDNTEQDIGFVDNELDTASLLSFVGAGDGFVSTWYDQSEEGNDAAQVSESAQPQIVSSGLVIKVNNVAAIDFDGTNNYLETDTFTEIPQPTSYFGVFKFDESKNQNIFDGSSTGNRQVIGDSGTTTYKIFGGIQITGGVTNTNQNSFNGILSTTDSLFINNISVISGNAGFDGIDEIVIGSNVFRSGAFLNGKIQELIFYPSDQTANREGIEANINKNYNIYWDGSQTGLLDDYPSAVAAYSLRALNSAYTGAAIEVRRSSDDAVQDIGLLYDGSLDTSSLLSFADGGDVFVAKWYDQSGGGNDALQNSASKQPQIVSSGSVINENGKISVKFNGTTDYIRNELSVGPTVTAFAVSRIVDEFDYNFIYDSSFGAGGRIRLGLRNIKEYFADNGEVSAAFSTTPSNGLQNLFFAKHTNSDVSISVNQDTLKTVASTNFYANTQYFVIGARYDGADHFLEGTIQELIFYPSDQSTNRAGIESNINSNYKIYWDGSQTGLLDDYPNASAAYSLRALSSAYTGPAIEVRKTVGGVTSKLDINFRYDGSLDTESLLSFAGSDDVFVAKWYDQSGEGNDVAQISQSAQPKIVSSGVVVTTSDNYAIDFSGSTKTLVNETFDNSTQVSSVFTIAKSTSSAPQVITDGATLASRQVSGYYAGNPSVFAIYKGTTIKSATPINTNMNLLSTFFDVNSDLYLNGAKIMDSVNAGSDTREGLTLGSGVNSAASFEGSIFEVIVFDGQNKSSDRVGIETNINNHYTIY